MPGALGSHITSSGTVIADGCKTSCGCWELNPGPAERKSSQCFELLEPIAPVLVGFFFSLLFFLGGGAVDTVSSSPDCTQAGLERLIPPA